MKLIELSRSMLIWAAALLLVSTLFYFLIERHNVMQPKNYKIAIMFRAKSPRVKRQLAGIFDELDQSKLPYEVTVYDGNDNPTLIRSHIEDAIDKKHDLFCTFGITLTPGVKEALEKRHIDAPVVFAFLSNPEKYGLIESRESSGNNLTGIAYGPDYYDMTSRVNVLFEVRPNLEKIVIPFSEDVQFLHDEANALEKEVLKQAKELGKTVKVVKFPVKNSSEVVEKLKPLSSDADAILLLADVNIIRFIDGIVKLCNSHGITLYASDLDSVKNGAGIGYGEDIYQTARACGKVILKILVDKKKPSDIPVASLFDPEVHINTETKDLQGIVFDRDRVQHPLLKNTVLVSS